MARSTLVESVASTRRLAASTLGRPAPPACPRPWWPSRGGITTRETDHVLRGGSHIRLVHQWFTWTAANLARMKCDNDVTYEADAAYYRADGGKFLGEELGWMAATNLPSSYLDTRAMDPKCCSVYTIGTDDADKLVAGKRYFTLIRTTQGDATTDTGVPQAQMGYHRFTHCPHFEVMWCVFSRPNGTVNLLDLNPNVQFEHIVPGTDTWTR
jgi:hypothetical protein